MLITKSTSAKTPNERLAEFRARHAMLHGCVGNTHFRFDPAGRLDRSGRQQEKRVIRDGRRDT